MPTPQSATIELGRPAPLYEGTTFSLTCIITPYRTGVDTDFMIQWNFYGPGTLVATDRVTRSDIDLQTTLMFDPLAMNDNGTYECFATVISTSLSQYPHVIASDTIMNNTMICITSKSSTISIK